MKTRKNGIAKSKVNAYRKTFVSHVHILLSMGFARLQQSPLPSLDEPDISGLLCEQIEDVMDDESSPEWVDDYEVHDDPPVHKPKRKGKHRRRVDIKLKSRRTRPRLRFCFEAKSLKSNRSVGEYLGTDGLGRFLDGSYSSDQPIGGMLAYVLTDSCEEWRRKIESRVDRTKHKLGRDGEWSATSICAELRETYRTVHKRPKKLSNIAIIHTLLDCTGSRLQSQKQG